jgi:DNA polymerase-3 subunit beta
MEISIERDALLNGIGHVLGVVDKRGTMPILSHCLLKTNGDGITIAATDLEIGFRGHCPAEVAQPGALTVPADCFSKLISALPKGSLTLVKTDKAGLKIQVGESRYQLNGLAAEQFPEIPGETGVNLLEVDARLLKEMIRKTIFSATANEQQYHLRGIFWEVLEPDEGHWWLRLVSTDGHRLSLIERPLPGGEQLGLGQGILVPLKAAREICRFVEGQEKVTLCQVGQSLSLQAEDKYLSIQLLDGKFPEYRRIIPEGFAYRFAVNRLEFIGALKRIAQLSTERFKGVILKLSAGSAEVTFANPEVGEGREHISVKLGEGEASELPLELGCNAPYLLEPLQAMSGDTVLLEINDLDRPFRITDQGDPHYFGLVMPMSL